MNPSRVDSIVDLTYGLLIAVSVALIVVAGNAVGLAFGFGVLTSYVLHVGWKMARFDPNWMTTAVKETVEETMDESVERAVEETMDESVERAVEETMDESVERAVEETMDESVDESVERAVGETVEEAVEQTLADQPPTDPDDGSDDR